MKKFLGVLVVGVLALGLTSTAYANYCSFDAVPAATLLFPFVAYDYEGGFDGQTTQLAITNVSSEAQIVHITVWTDYSVAILDFNITLTGYDVARMNIRDILGFGLLPTEDAATGRNDNIWSLLNAGGTPFDDGPYSDHNELWETLPTIDGLLRPQSTGVLDCDPEDWVASPVNYLDPIPQGVLDIFEGYLTASQTAAKSYVDCDDELYEFAANDPWFITRDSGPVWLYVTADVVAACNKELPDGLDSDYFSIERETTTGVIDNNVLIGDVIWMDAQNRFSEADNAVHLEANPAGFPGAVPTFYFRYVDGINSADYREPLPTAWAFRYQLLEDAGINTWVRAFKASSLNRTVYDLGSNLTNFGNIGNAGPAALYARSCIPYTYYAWDEDEGVNSFTSEEDPWSGGPESPIRPVPNLLPLETQEVDISQFSLVGSEGDAFGWLLFVWPKSNGYGAGAILDDDWYQTWMGVKYSGFGNYTAALSGAVMANYNCDQGQVLPGLGLGLYAPPPTE